MFLRMNIQVVHNAILGGEDVVVLQRKETCSGVKISLLNYLLKAVLSFRTYSFTYQQN